MRRGRRVLIHALSARAGGGQTYLKNLLAELPAGVDAEVFLLAPTSLQVGPDPRLHRLRAPVYTRNPLIRTVWERLRLPSLVRQVDPDVLFFPGGVVNLSMPRGVRSVTMFRNMIPFDDRQRRRYPWGLERVRNWVLQRVLLKSMHRVDSVIFLSNYAKQVVQSRASKDFDSCPVIPHGITRSFCQAQVPRPQWLPPEPFIVYVSPFHVYKNHLEVVRAFAKLCGMRETPERLVLVGGRETTWYGRRVRQAVEELGLADRVLMVGHVPHEDLPSVYAHAKVNVFASESENCPNILLEALGAGRPLLASSRPPMPEFAADAAVYFDPASAEDLANKLGSVLDDSDCLAEYARRARDRASRYSLNETARRTWQVLLNGRGGRRGG